MPHWSQTAIIQSPIVYYQGTNAGGSLTGSADVWTIWVQAMGSSTQTSLGGQTTTGNICQHQTHALIQPAWIEWQNTSHARTDNRFGELLQARGRMSPEDRAIVEAHEAERKRKYEAMRVAKALAEKKAEILLRQMLTPEQKEDLTQKGCFYLHVGEKKFRIDRGHAGNVKLVDERNEVVESYCIHPEGGIPDADAMLAQKLLLETDLETFERVANITARSARGRSSYGRGRAEALALRER